jgi:hypothetical protein
VGLTAVADAVFDFEDESGLNLDGATPDNTRRGKLPQEISKTPSPPRTSERPLSRRKNSLPLSFEALRPSSLPAPSHVRPGPSGSQTGTQTSPTSRRMPHSRVVSPTLPNPTESVGQVRSMARDSMLRKLAATDVPTYRQGWEQESPSWQIFAQKRGSQDPVPSGTAIAEEEDEGNERGRGDKEDIEADVSTVNEEDPSGIDSWYPDQADTLTTFSRILRCQPSREWASTLHAYSHWCTGVTQPGR